MSDTDVELACAELSKRYEKEGFALVEFEPPPARGRPYADWHETAFNAVNRERRVNGDNTAAACAKVNEMRLGNAPHVSDYSFLKMYRTYMNDQLPWAFLSAIADGDLETAAVFLKLSGTKIQKLVRVRLGLN